MTTTRRTTQVKTTETTEKTAGTKGMEKNMERKDAEETAGDNTAGLRILAITDTGCEAACALEIARWLPGVAPAAAPTRPCIVEIRGTLAQAALLAYHLQCARRVIVACAPTAKSIPQIEGLAFDAAIRDLVVYEGATFKAEGDVLWLDLATGMPRPKMPMTQELVETVGGWAHGALALPVDLKRPGFVVYAAATPEGVEIGIDMAGFSLSRREYRIMLSSRSIKATVAAAAAIHATEDGGSARGKGRGTVLDPFVDDGTLCIETALLRTRTSPRRFVPLNNFSFTRFAGLTGTDWPRWKAERDAMATPAEGERRIVAYAGSMREMKAVRTNSKLAGVDDHILSTKVDLDWVDLKREEGSVGAILTSPVTSGKSLAPKAAARLQEMLFDQGGYILARGGSITCLTDKPDEVSAAAAKHGFTPKQSRDALMGRRRISIITFSR